jgi:hypothetical protein
MTHVLLEQLAAQRQTELAARATRNQPTRNQRTGRSGPSAVTSRRTGEARPRLFAARLAALVGRS